MELHTDNNTWRCCSCGLWDHVDLYVDPNVSKKKSFPSSGHTISPVLRRKKLRQTFRRSEPDSMSSLCSIDPVYRRVVCLFHYGLSEGANMFTQDCLQQLTTDNLTKWKFFVGRESAGDRMRWKKNDTLSLSWMACRKEDGHCVMPSCL
jgi:hypothetical protein